MFLRHATILAAALILAQAPASAAVTIRAGRVYTAPALAGGRVVWTERPGHGPVAVVRSDAPAGGAARTLLSLPRGPHFAQLFDEPVVAASPDLVAAGIEGGWRHRGDIHAQWTAWLGSPVRPLARLDEICPRGSGSFDVSGTRIAGYDCHSGDVVVLDERSGEPEAHFPGGPDVRLAGRYLAVVPGTPRDVVVYDLDSRLETYRIPAEKLGYGLFDFDVAEDGSVAAVYDGPQDDRYEKLVWGSPAEPDPVDVPVPTRVIHKVRFARPGLIAYSGS
ncbi:MAG: hypothetical protein QOG41_273, partial [Thermoleophilaceae bacterium]|nr:hypothetical protein [Thermoleophilaceae bacterium]